MAQAHNKTPARVAKLKELLTGETSLLIVMQDNPDADAIASAVALRRIANVVSKVSCSLAHGGSVGRAENRALARYLQLNLRPLSELDVFSFDLIAMVDTQPGTGNNSLPEGVLPDIVIDHHPIRPRTRQCTFTDVRSNYGATATILYEYLQFLDILPDTPLATGLIYAIRSDTQDMGMQATAVDIGAIQLLYPLANLRMLSEIQRGRVERSYFKMLADGLRNARAWKHCVATCLGEIDNPDMIAEIADLLLRDDLTTWSFCSAFAQGKLQMSLRTSEASARADLVMRKLVSRRGSGGGHNSLAGGQIPLKENTAAERKRLETLVRKRLLKQLGEDDKAEGEKLV
ncbi:MAG: DHH family phosphoesterase [Sedimentisphaerales bacterium]|nr:DHH family phosphoesterase [Sedimentisphaerales bacterium]